MTRCPKCDTEVPATASGCPQCDNLAATVAIETAPKPQRKSITHVEEEEGRFLPGTLVNGRYRIIGMLGKGGMGEVYRATDLTLAQPVALKFLPEQGVTDRVLERFHGEVRIARQISHPNVCRVYDIGEVDGQPFISMEYVDGEDLAGLLQRIGRLPADKALETARKICAGLAAAHDRGVIHRDLKPQNIMLNRRGEPVIMDFGLAAVADQLTGAEARNGTPAYMSPEQLRGDEVTAKSDIYALGLLLYELFSGKRAYEASTIPDLLRLQESAQLTSLVSVASDIDPQVEKVVRRCLQPDPGQRPATPLAVAAALPGGDPLAAALAAGETPSPELVAASGQTSGMPLRHSVPILAFVLISVIAFPLITGQWSALHMSGTTYPPVVVAHEARKISASFGYPDKPADSMIDFLDGSPIWNYWKTHDRKGLSWSSLFTAEAPYTYYYRESPNLLVAGPSGYIHSGNPPPRIAGMVEMRMSFSGVMREFEAIPPERPAAWGGGFFVNEEAIFQAAGLPRDRFAETEPQVTPLVAFDARKAWKGSVAALPGVDVRVEAASLAGRLTYARVIYPWSAPRREPDAAPKLADYVGRLLLDAFIAIGAIAGLLRCMFNLRRNRGDRQGAFRLAMLSALLSFLVWLGSAHHVPAPAEWSLLVNALAEACFSGLVMWILYLALEPAVRARWPHALVTWSRLMNGRFGDPQLGAHVLTGASAGMTMAISFTLYFWVTDYARNGTPALDSLAGHQGAFSWLANNARTFDQALRMGFVVFFAMFGLRVWSRNNYAATLVVSALFAAADNGGIWNRPNPWVEFPFEVAIYSVLVLVLLRCGIVATTVAVVFVNSINKVNLGPGLNTWYTPYGLATLAVIISVVLYGFWRSVGNLEMEDPGV